MKRILSMGLLSLVALCFTIHASAADDYSKYYTNLPVQLQQVSAPIIPATTVSIKDYGAVGDGVTLCTEAFNKAMSDLQKRGGGHLNVPAGVWLSGPIAFKDNIDLHLDRNAMILFSPDKSLYNKDSDGKVLDRCVPMINISKRKNVSITGEGTIDGNGKYWRPVKHSKVSDTEWNEFKAMGGTITGNGQFWYPYQLNNGLPEIANSAEETEKLRADLVRITDCENILIQGVTFQNSPRFHVHPIRCTNVIVDGITARCPWNAQNGDAIDLACVRKAIIVNSIVDAGDDGLCMKGGVGNAGTDWGKTEDILIQNCKVYHAHGGFVIGSEYSGGMNKIVVRDCTFSGTDTGLRFKSGVGRGGLSENIFINNIYMNNIKDQAIVFECTYEDKKMNQNDGHLNEASAAVKKEIAPFTPDYQDIHISNLVCNGAESAIVIKGLAELPVHDITIDNSTISAINGIDMINATNIKMNNVNIISAKTPSFKLNNVKGIILNGKEIK